MISESTQSYSPLLTTALQLEHWPVCVSEIGAELDTLATLLRKLLGPAPYRATYVQGASDGRADGPPPALSVHAEGLVGQAQAAWEDAHSALRDADWTEYGLQMEKLGQILKLLGENESR